MVRNLHQLARIDAVRPHLRDVGLAAGVFLHQHTAEPIDADIFEHPNVAPVYQHLDGATGRRVFGIVEAQPSPHR